MGSVGSGLELGVSLGGYEEGVLGKLAHFHDTSVRGQTGQTKTVFGEDGTIIVVDLITMTMSLGDILPVSYTHLHFYQREGFEIQREGLDEVTREKDYVMVWQRGNSL